MTTEAFPNIAYYHCYLVTHLVISTYDLCGIVLTLGATYYLVSCTHTRPSASRSTKQWFDDTILLSWMIRSHAVKTSQKNHSGLLCKNVCSTSPFIVLQHWCVTGTVHRNPILYIETIDLHVILLSQEVVPQSKQ